MKTIFYISFCLTALAVPAFSIDSKDHLGPLDIEIRLLRNQVRELKRNYESLCNEIRHLSTHILLHERGLNHISAREHGILQSEAGIKSERVHRNIFDKHINRLDRVEPETIIPSANQHEDRPPPIIQIIQAAPAIRLSDIDNQQVVNVSASGIDKNKTHSDHSEEGHVHILPIDLGSPVLQPESECCTSPVKKCSVLHEHSYLKEINTSKSLDEQFQEWSKTVLRTNENEINRRNDMTLVLGSQPVDNEQNDLIYMEASTRTQENSVGEEIDNELKKDDMVYATCNVIPNRHISLILQQNVKGVINLWQKKDGQSPLYTHVKLEGFRIPGEPLPKENGQRKRRETNLSPIELSMENHPPSSSFDHGFHVHANGDLSRSCQSTGLHFNPTNSSHGGPMDTFRHVGDLGNLRTDQEGKIDAEYSYPFASLVGNHSIIGRSLVIHAQSDDLGRNKDNEASIATGNSGPKIACCVVEQVDRLPEASDSRSTVNAVQGASSSNSG